MADVEPVLIKTSNREIIELVYKTIEENPLATLDTIKKAIEKKYTIIVGEEFLRKLLRELVKEGKIIEIRDRTPKYIVIHSSNTQ